MVKCIPRIPSWGTLWLADPFGGHQLTVAAYAIVRSRYETIPINLSSVRKNRAILLCPVFDRGINSTGKLLLLFFRSATTPSSGNAVKPPAFTPNCLAGVPSRQSL